MSAQALSAVEYSKNEQIAYVRYVRYVSCFLVNMKKNVSVSRHNVSRQIVSIKRVFAVKAMLTFFKRWIIAKVGR